MSAERETRTLMGLLPLAPKASVSTIPPSRRLSKNLGFIPKDFYQILSFLLYSRGIDVLPMVPRNFPVGVLFLIEVQVDGELYPIELCVAVEPRIA